MLKAKSRKYKFDILFQPNHCKCIIDFPNPNKSGFGTRETLNYLESYLPK